MIVRERARPEAYLVATDRNVPCGGKREVHPPVFADPECGDDRGLDAYGWTDIQPVYDFRQQLDESTRLTWGEDTRDEVLARLLELNRVMAEEEAKQAASAPAAKKTAARAPRKSKKTADPTPDLFASAQDDPDEKP